MKLALLSIFLALPVFAEDKQPEPTIEQLKVELAQTKESLENTTKLLQAYAGKFQQCDAQLTSVMVLGQPKQKGPSK